MARSAPRTPKSVRVGVGTGPRDGGDTKCPPAHRRPMADLPDDRIRAVESLVDDWLHEAAIPGASVVVCGGAEIAYAEGFGARDLERNAPATPDTLYGMGSLAKPITSLSVLQLAEDGRLSVEDPVDD